MPLEISTLKFHEEWLGKSVPALCESFLFVKKSEKTHHDNASV